MRLTIRSARYDLDDDLQTYIERRLDFAVSRFATRIRSVDVLIGDDNGPRGGIDKFCTIRCAGTGMDALLVRAEHDDVRSAVDLACARLERAIVRSLERRRDARLRSAGEPGTHEATPRPRANEP